MKRFIQQNVADELVAVRFKTQYNSVPTKGEINLQPSRTIPDQTMSISEILRRFGSGLPLGGARVEFYEGEEDMWEGVDPRTLDISEREEMIEDRMKELADLKKKYQEIGKKLAADKKAEKEKQEALEKRLNDLKSSPENPDTPVS